MKYEQNDSPILASNEIANTSSVMGMTLDGALEMTKHLRDTVYSNKILAIVREIASNAIDEHVLHGIDKNVEISLNYNEDSQLQIRFRDYAKGLSEEGVRNIFGMYGNSTKRNNNVQVGCLGIGSKSPFCYTSSYFVVSYHGGTKTLYSCSLGGNDQGTSVGFIHKIHSEPSNETGLEVIVDVKEGDKYSFKSEIFDFISLSPHKIVANVFGEEIAPSKELQRIQGEDFVVRVLEGNTSEKHHAHLMMGGVCYGFINLPKDFKQKKDSFFVVDVNIGQMTVTLSRESFHDTPINSAFKNKVSSFLEELAEKDLATFSNLKVEQIINDVFVASGLKAVEGEYFSASLSSIHKDIWPLINDLDLLLDLNEVKTFSKKNNKPILLLMHYTSSWSWRNYWIDKARKFAKDNNTNYYHASATIWNKLSPEAQTKLESYFFTMGIKSLPYPKEKSLSASGVGYACYYSNGRSIGKFTPLGFLNWMVRNHFDVNHADFKTIDEGKVWVEAQKKKISSTSELTQLSFSPTGGRCVSCWQSRSSKFIKEIKELGFFGFKDAAYQSVSQKIAAKQEEENKKIREISRAKKKYINFNSRTLNAIQKAKNAERINKFFDFIHQEKSVRRKTLASFDSCHSYYGCVKNVLERDELRQILRLK